MIFWPGGGCASKLSKAIREAGINRHLISFYSEQNKHFNPGDKNAYMMDGFELFVDSGAFSAWSQGAEVSLEDYVEFIKYHCGIVDHCINLDTLPASHTPWALEEAAQASWKNYQALHELGVPVLPVYHYGEDQKWLDLFCRETDYVCLGGLVGVHYTDRVRWLDTTFARAKKINPDIKLHGLGIGDLELMQRMPWYSVDSTSWLRVAAMGNLWIPKMQDGRFVFDAFPLKAYVDDLHKVPDIEAWAHYCGTTLLACIEDYYARFVVMLTYFREFCAVDHQQNHFRKNSLLTD